LLNFKNATTQNTIRKLNILWSIREQKGREGKGKGKEEALPGWPPSEILTTLNEPW